MTSYGVLKKKIAGLLVQNEALIAERDGALAQAKSLDADLTECEAERDALRAENKLLREMIDLVMAIPNMSNEQLEQLKANCRIALSAEKQT